MPSFSIVTPVYNSASFLEATLDSVARLTVSHEHIVVDGGSSDGTVALLESCSDLNLSWISEPDRGQTHAVNKGFERAQGELLGWLNGDDEYVSEGVDRAVEHLLGKQELDAVFGGMDITDERGEVPPRVPPRAVQLAPLSLLGRLPADADHHLPSSVVGARRTRRGLRRRRGL